MNLKDFIQDYKGEYVKVGSRIAYIYCGVVDDSFENAILEQEKHYIKEMDISIRKAKADLMNLEPLWTKKTNLAVNMYVKENQGKASLEKGVMTLRARMKAQKESAKKELETKLKKLVEIKDDFRPFFERNVRYHYKSRFERKQCEIILLAGHEQGRYWSIRDYTNYMSDKNWSPNKRYGARGGVL